MNSQAERILAVLQDGKEHSALEFALIRYPILAVHSRISDLRKKGYEIVCERDKEGVYRYTLTVKQQRSLAFQ
jgi:hypothetical protein